MGGPTVAIGALEAEERIEDHCRSAVLILQPVVESNPDNVALAETLENVLGVMRDIAPSASP